MPARKKHRSPGDGDKDGLAEIGLRHQQRHNNAQKQDRDQIARDIAFCVRFQ